MRRWQRMGRAGDDRFLERQPDAEGRTTTRLALDGDVSPHHLAKAFADHEPETGATVFTRGGGIGLGEFLEQSAYLLRRHSNAGIGNRDGNPVAAVLLSLPCVNADGAALCELVGVAHEVQQRLAQPHLVGMHRPYRAVAMDR